MAARPNIGGALCSTPQSLADAHAGVPCSNDAKTRNPLKFYLQGCPKLPDRSQPVVDRKLTIVGHVEEILLLNKFFTARRNARIASAGLVTAIPSVCLSVRLSVRPLSHAGIVSY